MPTLSCRHLLIAAFATFAILAPISQSPAQNGPSEPQAQRVPSGSLNPESLTTEQIVANMMSRNDARAAALRGYTGRRIYRLEYRGFPSDRNAELTVEAHYSAPATKELTVISEKGSKFLVDKVLKRLLSSEQDAQNAANKRTTALTPQNYIFELAGEQVTDQGRFYILKVHPRVASKYLYRGEIWVDANDFAIERIEAEPSQNPSFWISHARIEQRYARFGSFWLPVRNESTSKVRLGGTATLVIEYQDYSLCKNAPQNKVQTAMTETEKTF